MTERTLVLVKPDGVARGLVGEVISRIERKGLKLVAVELRTVPQALAEEHYAEHKERSFFGELLEFITSGPLVALAVEGPRAIPAFRQLVAAPTRSRRPPRAPSAATSRWRPSTTWSTARTPRSRPSAS